MSETTENQETEAQDEGVTKMSFSDALNFAESGQSPTETVQEEVVNEVENEEVVVDDAEKETVDEVIVDEKPIIEENEIVEKEVVEDKVETQVEDKKESFDDLYDDEDKAYFAFKKKNKGATRADYNESKVDYDSLSRKDLLRKSLREQYDLKGDDAEIDDYIESELGIPMDSDESDMTVTEKVRLRKQTDGYIADKKAQQQKWNESKVEDVAQKEEEKVEMLTLEDGSTIEKAKYEKIVEDRNNYIKGNEEALNRVNATSFKLKVDDNGSEREVEYAYTFDKEDKHRMQSLTSDVVKSFNETYTTENGYDHDSLNENKAWEDPKLRGKMLQKLAQSIRAEAIEEVMKEKGNITIGSQKSLDKQKTDGIKIVPMSELLNNY